MDDLRLARAAASGDPEARERFVRAQAPAALRLLRTLARNREDAEDLTGAAMLRALGAIGRYDGRVPLRVWTLAIALNEGRRYRRRKPWLALTGEIAIDSHAASSEDAAVLGVALGRLPTEQRAAFVLCAVEGMEAAEAALALGVPEGTVKSRVHHARRRLRLSLSGTFPDRLPTPCDPEPNHVPSHS